MEFDSKCDFAPLTVLLGLLLCPGRGVSFLGGIQHSPVDGCLERVVILELLQEKMSAHPSTLPS